MKKIIFAITCILLFAGVSFSQPTVWISEGTADVRTYDHTFVITLYFDDVDSAETLTAKIYDMSYFSNQDSLIITYEYVSSVDDTVVVDYDTRTYYNDGAGADSYLTFDAAITADTCIGLAATGTPTQNVERINSDHYGDFMLITVTQKSASSDNDANGTLVVTIEPFRDTTPTYPKLEWY